MKQFSFLFAVFFSIGVAPVAAQDAKVEVDNAWVRVIRGSQAPKTSAALADHSASVVVYMTDARQKWTGVDGKVRKVRKKAGDVAYFEAGKYAIENESNAMVHIVTVELKDGAKKVESASITLDPVKLDPKHHLVPLENDRVRVLHTILEPHLKSPLHQHPHYVVVYLTELHTTQNLADGRTIDNPRKAGELGWREASQHVTENIGEKRAEEIQIELK
jgi:quercetin dioxygenase-like cupin family protein